MLSPAAPTARIGIEGAKRPFGDATGCNMRRADPRMPREFWVRIGSIVIHTPEFERTVAFWQAALGYVPRNLAQGGWVVLQDPSGRGPNLSFQARDRRPRSRSWIHLDLYTADQETEVERLLSLGAARYPWRYRPAQTLSYSRIPVEISFVSSRSRIPRVS
jgi:hypothetical protein